jgi:type IV pilus assembly protein PilY1
MQSATGAMIRRLTVMSATAAVAAAALLASGSSVAGAGPAPITIAQIPLTVALPAHPQVLFAVTNSESMDGTLSGAIMTGSGSLGGALGAGLANSSSPANYTIPAGFTPPLNNGNGVTAPYTVLSGGHLADNSPSRLNVAKAGVSAILQAYMEYADFALMDFTGNSGAFATSVYYMSPAGGFTFTNIPGPNQVANPCLNANIALLDVYDQACKSLNTFYGVAAGVTTRHYMNLGSTGIPGDTLGTTSDNPSINDVFYGSATEPCVDYTGPNPASPYPPHFSLANYESGAISVGYTHNVPAGGCPTAVGPTNAGYVPYSTQVMYLARGFGFLAAASPNSGQLVVGMKSSGASPTQASVNTAIAAFNTALSPETNAATGEIKSVALQSPIAGLLKGANSYFVNTNPASSNGCAATRYVVLVTDGLPTEDLAGHNWPPLGSISASPTGYNVWANFNGDGSLNSTNDQALTDTINQLTALKNAGIKTYVIGLGAGVDPAYNAQASATLTAMSVAGGTNTYFPANSPANLTNAMQVILAKILAETESVSSATVNTTGLNTNSVVFQPSFDTSDTNQDWTGDIKAYPINSVTGTVNTGALLWSAQAQLDAQSAVNGWATGRIIATWDPVVSAGIPFRWSPGTPASGIATSTALGQALQGNLADPSGQHALEYLRGHRVWEIANGGPYRTRTHVLGDLVDSAPLYVGAANGPYQTSSYYSFAATYANRAPVLYVGANDGMLHAFSATTGQELFAYIPHGVFANLEKLTSQFYNEQHLFYVDGAPQASDVQFSDGSWHTLLVGGERGGGSTVFALDVTNPAAITDEAALSSSVLWEFSDPNMGLTFSTPAIAQTAYGASGNNLGFTVFFGNGYNSPAQKPYLYALDPKTGTLLPGMPIDLCAQVAGACNAALANGLSSVVVVNSLGGLSAAATTLYAGDLQGNLWRVDVHDPNPQHWVVSLLFQATDSSGNRQAITTTPLVSLNPAFPRLAGTMVYIGTGQMLGIPDLGTTQVQTMYGVYDSGSNASTLTRSNLVQQTLSALVVNGYSLRSVSGTEVALPSQNGWYVDFTLLSGERMVTDPRLDGGSVVITSVQPSANTCIGGDVAYLMEFNFAGGAFSNPQFDYTGTGVVTPALHAVNGVLLGSVYASAPVFSNYVGANGANGTGGSVALVTESNGTIVGYAQKGLQQQRFSWWQVE